MTSIPHETRPCENKQYQKQRADHLHCRLTSSAVLCGDKLNSLIETKAFQIQVNEMSCAVDEVGNKKIKVSVIDSFHFISVRYSYKIICTKAKIGHNFFFFA